MPLVAQRKRPLVPVIMQAVLLAAEREFETLVPRIFHVSRTVHVADEMYDKADRDRHRRIVLIAVIFHVRNAVVQKSHRVAFGIGHVVSPGIDLVGVPRVGVPVGRRVADLIHPRGIIDDRTAAEILFDVFLGFGRQVAFGDVGDRIVADFPPAERRRAPTAEHGRQQTYG